jgi:cytochrome c
MKLKSLFLALCVSAMGLGAMTAEAAEAHSITALLEKADVAAGETTAHACLMCHSFNKGGVNKIGPNLWGITGNSHAHLDNFSYSSAMKSLHDKKWTDDELNQFLYSPQAYIPGTKMPFAGIKDDEARANVIAYLHSLK